MNYTIHDGFPFYIELLEDLDYRQQFASTENVEMLETIDEEKANYR